MKSLLYIPNLTLQTLKIRNNSFTEHRIQYVLNVLFSLKNFSVTISYDTFDYISEFLTLMDVMHNVSPDQSCQVKNCISIKRLILRHSDNSKSLKMAENGTTFLNKFTQLTELYFSGIFIESGGSVEFGNFVHALSSSRNSLAILSLTNCQLDFFAAAYLKNFVIDNIIITCLTINWKAWELSKLLKG